VTVDVVLQRLWRDGGVPPGLQRDSSILYGTFWSHGVLDHPTKGVARLRNARMTVCGC
jgi:hypothetical protein